jgi:hypothetical protein
MSEGLYELVNEEIQDKQSFVDLFNEEYREFEQVKKNLDFCINLLEKRETYDFGNLQYLNHKVAELGKEASHRSKNLKENYDEYQQSLAFLNAFYKSSNLRTLRVLAACQEGECFDEPELNILRLMNYAVRGGDEAYFFRHMPKDFLESIHINYAPLDGNIPVGIDQVAWMRDQVWNLVTHYEPEMNNIKIRQITNLDVSNLFSDCAIQFILDDSLAELLTDYYVTEMYPTLQTLDFISKEKIEKIYKIDANSFS